MKVKKVLKPEPFIALACITAFFVGVGSKMGAVNFINTIMNTAYSLLTDTVWYLLAIMVMAGAVGALLIEFGVVSLFNKILSPLIKPLYGMPGASIVGILTTFLSDNPAILTLSGNDSFKQCFRKYQIPALANVGTSFGMGLIVVTYMIGLGASNEINLLPATLIGILGAVIGSIISTRLMLIFTSKAYGKTQYALVPREDSFDLLNYYTASPGGIGKRILNSVLDGGKKGVQMGLNIIPGVLIICTFVMILANGTSSGQYSGEAYEGIALLPWVADKMNIILQPLFGFTSESAIAVPITALGSAGASLGLIPQLLSAGLVAENDIAVFTSMCMCWSGYLSTHVAMMDELGCTELTGKAIISHTIGGFCAGIASHLIFTLLM